jgi:hypothetical protein
MSSLFLRTASISIFLNVGCIPSKALLHTAEIINEAAEAQHLGVTFNEPKIDIDAVRKNKVPMNMPYNIQNTNICNGIFHISFLCYFSINNVAKQGLI